MPSSHLILCRSLFLLPQIPPSNRVFSTESTLCMRWSKNWSFSFSIIPSKEHPGLISFRMAWLDLLAVHGTLKHLLQHHSSKASILWHSAFFTVQFSHPKHDYWKNLAVTRRTFVGKVMSLHLNMLSRLVIAFLPRSKRLLITLLMPSKNLCGENTDFQFLITEFWNWCYFFFSLVWADICNNEQWNFVECWLYQLDKLFLSLEINKNYLYFFRAFIQKPKM